MINKIIKIITNWQNINKVMKSYKNMDSIGQHKTNYGKITNSLILNQTKNNKINLNRWIM